MRVAPLSFVGPFMVYLRESVEQLPRITCNGLRSHPGLVKKNYISYPHSHTCPLSRLFLLHKLVSRGLLRSLHSSRKFSNQAVRWQQHSTMRCWDNFGNSSAEKATFSFG